MGKYSEECYDGKEKHLKQIANEAAEANRLKRIELGIQFMMVMKEFDLNMKLDKDIQKTIDASQRDEA